MVLSQTPTISMQTFLKVFIVHGFLFGAFIFIAYKILKRDRKWLNVIVSLFYIFFAIGLFINFVYVLISFDPYAPIVRALYYCTMFFLLVGVFFLTVFLLILLKLDIKFTKQKQILLVLIYSIVALCMVLIPNGVSISSKTNWNPVYSLEYYLYVFIIYTISSTIPQMYCFTRIYKAIQQDFLKKRWKLFFLGMILFYIFTYGTITYHHLDIQAIRDIWSYISLGLSIFSAIFIYLGVGKLER